MPYMWQSYAIPVLIVYMLVFSNWIKLTDDVIISTIAMIIIIIIVIPKFYLARDNIALSSETQSEHKEKISSTLRRIT